MKKELKAIIKNIAKSIRNYCEGEEEYKEAYIYKQSSDNGNCTQYCINGKLSMLFDNLKKETIGYTNDYIKNEEYYVVGDRRFIIIKETLEEGMYIINVNNKVFFIHFNQFNDLSKFNIINIFNTETNSWITKGLSLDQENDLEDEEREFIQKVGLVRYRKLVEGVNGNKSIDEVDYFGGDIGEVTKLFEEAY